MKVPVEAAPSRRMRSLAAVVTMAVTLLALPACGCKSKPDGDGTGPDRPPGDDPRACDDARAGVESLYRADAAATPPVVKAGDDPAAAAALAEQLLGDNVAMVMSDCRRDPGRVAPCLRSAPSVARLERDCLLALDEEGSEGAQFAK